MGNASVFAFLLSIFTSSDADVTLCNLYGRKRTGRKTVAAHFANMLIIKQLFQRIVRVNVTLDNVAELVKK